jgi:ABC-type multidrug transport system ATPase subunit
VQSAIAPAGSGKTTAIRTLSRAWLGSGGTVIVLESSAVAADEFRGGVPDHTDGTLAQLA